jgi:hypothetical protein
VKIDVGTSQFCGQVACEPCSGFGAASSGNIGSNREMVTFRRAPILDFFNNIGPIRPLVPIALAPKKYEFALYIAEGFRPREVARRGAQVKSQIWNCDEPSAVVVRASAKKHDAYGPDRQSLFRWRPRPSNGDPAPSSDERIRREGAPRLWRAIVSSPREMPW